MGYKAFSDCGDLDKVHLSNNLTYTILNKEINSMVKDKENLKKMGQKAYSVAKENVEEKIYKEIKNTI
jgi:UDP-N-acetylglucosamine:LPS N-acetylglucosamine transferase